MLSHCDCPDESASIISGWMTMQEILYFYSQIPSLELVPSTLLIFCELPQNQFCKCSCTVDTKKICGPIQSVCVCRVTLLALIIK